MLQYGIRVFWFWSNGIVPGEGGRATLQYGIIVVWILE
jgi:hypothetical protein